MTLNLRQRVREMLESTGEADPGVIAQKILADLNDDEIRAALEETLRAYVRMIMRDMRMVETPSANASSKQAGIRELAADRLRFHIGNAEWRMLEEMTYENLIFAAKERRDIAQKNISQAARLENWAKAIKQAKVSTFGELPLDVQARLLRGVAA